MSNITKMVWYDDVKEKPVATRYEATLRYDKDPRHPYKVSINFSYNSSPGDVEEFKEFKFATMREALNCYNDLKLATEAKTIQ